LYYTFPHLFEIATWKHLTWFFEIDIYTFKMTKNKGITSNVLNEAPENYKTVFTCKNCSARLCWRVLFVGYNAVQSVETQPIFRRNMSILSSWSENNPSDSCLFLSWFILRPWRWRRYIPLKFWLTFNPELWNSSQPPLWELQIWHVVVLLFSISMQVSELRYYNQHWGPFIYEQ
jgi:hypothetical protein